MFLKRLPPDVRKCVRALKKLQFESVKIENEFHKELLQLEAKYDVRHQSLFEKVFLTQIFYMFLAEGVHIWGTSAK